MHKFSKKLMAFTLTLLLVFSMSTVIFHSLISDAASNSSNSSDSSSSSSLSSSSSSKEDSSSSSNSSSKNDSSSKSTSSSKPDFESKNNLKNIPAGAVELNETNFPDKIFRNYLINKGGYTTDGNDKYYTQDQIDAITSINCPGRGISNLTGIEHFTALTYLHCGNNKLSELDVSANTALTYLNCLNNDITELNISNYTNLKEIYCQNNQLTNLVVSNNTSLQILSCFSNKLKNLDVSTNKALEKLYCYGNQLDVLTLDNPSLNYLSCRNNNLKSLDIQTSTALLYLYCQNNHLTTLNTEKSTKLVEFSGKGQTSNAEYYEENGFYKVNMAEVVGKENVENLYMADQNNWDYQNGIATYKTQGEAPESLEYNYVTDGRENLLHVKLSLDPAPTKWTVTFNSNGGSTVEKQSVKDGQYAKMPEDPIKDGCVFYDWFKDGDDKAFVFDSTPIKENITLNATWDCNVTFNLNGGILGKYSSGKFVSTVRENEKVNQPEDPIKDGCKFAGWYEDEALTKKFDFNTPINHSINLYAKYEKIEPVNPSNDSQATNSASNDNNSSVNSSATGQDITLLTVCIAASFISIALISIVITHRKKHNK